MLGGNWDADKHMLQWGLIVSDEEIVSGDFIEVYTLELQWGLIVSDEEMGCRAEYETYRGHRFNGASSFPMRKCAALLHVVSHVLRLQWGLIVSDEEMDGVLGHAYLVPLLQWGLIVSDEEILWICHHPTAKRQLQWGLIVSDEEISHRFGAHLVIHLASMGPHRFR